MFFSHNSFLAKIMNKNLNIKSLLIDKPLKLDCGQTINDFPLAYETYGSLNDNKDNAILVFHALTGDQFASGINPVTKREGWWDSAVGPNKALDTNKYFVICANVLGGCMGSYGPTNIDSNTNKMFGITFPVITIRDMVRTQKYLLDYLEKSTTSLRINGFVIKLFFIYVYDSYDYL